VIPTRNTAARPTNHHGRYATGELSLPAPPIPRDVALIDFELADAALVADAYGLDRFLLCRSLPLNYELFLDSTVAACSFRDLELQGIARLFECRRGYFNPSTRAP